MSKWNEKKRVAMTGVTSLLVSAMLIGSVEYASNTYLYDNATAKAAQVREIEKTITPMEAAKSDGATSKEETVYAALNADGSVKEVVVSEWLKNSGGKGEIADISDLTDIENTKGNEKFTQDGDSLTWKTGKDDIYYQGSTDKEMPVSMEISYELDGKKMEPEKILGKSGKLKMTIKYHNEASQIVTVGDKNEEIYTPFMMATGMILPVDNFKNISIDNGKVFSEGDNNILVAYGMPGLQESLKLDDLDLGDEIDVDTDKLQDKITDTVTITADVKDFEMKATYTVATASIFGELEFDDLDDLDKIDDKMDDLTDATEKLIDGSEELEKGVKQLNSKYKTFNKGTKKLDKGAKDLSKGAGKLKKGVDDYTDGADKLVDSLGDYADGVKKISSGVKSYIKGANEFLTGATTLLSEKNMNELVGGAGQVKDGIATVDENLVKVIAGVKNLNDSVSSMGDDTSALASGISALSESEDTRNTVDALTGMVASEDLSNEEKEAIKAAIKYIKTGNKVAEQGAPALEKAASGMKALEAATNGKPDGAYDDSGKSDLALGLKTIESNLKSTGKSSEYGALYAGAAKLEKGAKDIASNAKTLRAAQSKLSTKSKDVATLVSGADTLYNSSTLLKSKSKTLSKSSAVLKSGAKTLSKGSNTLKSGMTTLAKGSVAVAKGISKLTAGATKLRKGTEKFKDEGTDKLTDTVGGLTDGIKDFKTRLEKIANVSSDYQSFAGLDDSMKGSVKFIMTTKEIKEKE